MGVVWDGGEGWVREGGGNQVVCGSGLTRAQHLTPLFTPSAINEHQVLTCSAREPRSEDACVGEDRDGAPSDGHAWVGGHGTGDSGEERGGHVCVLGHVLAQQVDGALAD